MIVTARPCESTLRELRELHDVCWAFETAWRNGESPSVAQWAQSFALDRELLLAELRATERDLIQEVAPSGESTSDFERVCFTGSFPHQSLPHKDERYDFLHEIARGGAGAVWLVYDRHLKRQSAVKLLLDSQDNAEMRRRLEREARLCGCLHHPGIVPIHELSHLHDGRPFISMKLIEGQNLAELLKAQLAASLSNAERKKKLRETWLPLFLQVCETVDYAHSRGVVHRDLKPSNIMVGAFGEVQVMDWGLGKIVSDVELPPAVSEPNASTRLSVAMASDTSTLSGGDHTTASLVETRMGAVLGTLSYMSPEQARGDNHVVDQRSDIFALGGILCRVLTGSAPFPTSVRQSIDDSPLGLAAIRAADMQRTRERISRSRVDKRLVQLTLACLADDPGERPATAAEVADRIRRVLARPQRRVSYLVSFAVLLAVLATYSYRVVVIQKPLPIGNDTLVLMQSFDALVRSGNTVAAEQLARTAVQTIDDVRLKVRLGWLLRCRAVYSESEAVLRSVLAADPTNPEAALELARLLKLTDRPTDAQQVLTFAIEHNPPLLDLNNEELNEVVALVDKK